eukprot:SAG31_NODE_13906_length_838_cov_1.399188_2_plen_25_part_01
MRSEEDDDDAGAPNAEQHSRDTDRA